MGRPEATFGLPFFEKTGGRVSDGGDFSQILRPNTRNHMDTRPPTSADADLAARLARGDGQAFEALYRQAYRMVASLCTNFNAADAAPDVFQDALFVLVKRLREPDFRLTVQPSTFLYAIARNILLKKNSGSAAARQPVAAGSDAELARLAALPTEPEADLSATEKDSLLNLMAEKIAELEEACRQVLTLSFYEKLPQADIAARLGYSEAFVKVKKFRCLDHLRRLVRGSSLFKDLAGA